MSGAIRVENKLLLYFCEPFQAGNFQAGRQAEDLSERAQRRDAFWPATCPLPTGQEDDAGGAGGAGVA